MSRFAEQLLVSISMLDIRVRCCIVRLDDPADTEALHDLRIALRSLRSLLRPLRGLPAVDLLEQAAADVGHLTNPIRELQVFVAELVELGMRDVAQDFSAGLLPAVGRLESCAELPRLLVLLDGFPAIWRLAAREGCLRRLHKRVAHHLERDLGQFPHALHAAPEDLHTLRLQVKRLRYGSETYSNLTPVSPRQLKLLRRLQQALGEWNDCQHWLADTVSDDRFALCRPDWLTRAQAAVRRAGKLLERFEQLRN